MLIARIREISKRTDESYRKISREAKCRFGATTLSGAHDKKAEPVLKLIFLVVIALMSEVRKIRSLREKATPF